MVEGSTALNGLSGWCKDQWLGVISALIGFALGTVRVDLETGQRRYTFGLAELIGGICFIPIATGLFGLGELTYAIYSGLHKSGSGSIVQYDKEKRFWPRADDWPSTRMTMARGSILSFVVGVIPEAEARTFSEHASFVETCLMFGAGLVGFFMQLYGFPPAALVLALVLGPLAEDAFRQTLTVSRGSFMIFVERTPSLFTMAITVALVVLLPLLNRFGSQSAKTEKAGQ